MAATFLLHAFYTLVGSICLLAAAVITYAAITGFKEIFRGGKR